MQETGHGKGDGGVSGGPVLCGSRTQRLGSLPEPGTLEAPKEMGGHHLGSVVNTGTGQGPRTPALGDRGWDGGRGRKEDPRDVLLGVLAPLPLCRAALPMPEPCSGCHGNRTLGQQVALEPEESGGAGRGERLPDPFPRASLAMLGGSSVPGPHSPQSYLCQELGTAALR